MANIQRLLLGGRVTAFMYYAHVTTIIMDDKVAGKLFLFFYCECCIKATENDDSSEHLQLPKGPVPAFILYSRDKRKALPQMSLLESTQKLSQMWKVASSEEKEVLFFTVRC